MTKTVPVAEAYSEKLQSVVAMAAASYDRSLAEYRRLVAEMATRGGELPGDMATQLIEVCEALGIPPETLGDDASTVSMAADLQGKIDAVHQRNAERRAPLPALEAEYQSAKDTWLKVSAECQERMRVAEQDLRVKRAAYEKVQMRADEPTAGLEQQLLKTREQNPHLFGPVPREVLARITDRARRRAAL